MSSALSRLRVKVSTAFPDWPLQRQSPGGLSRWGACDFYVNQDVEECDAWIVLEGTTRQEVAKCPRSNLVFIALEPPSITAYPQAYLAQFSMVVTCARDDIQHSNLVVSQQAQPWHVGRVLENGRSAGFRWNYDELAALPPVAKKRKLSVICSNKRMSEGHRQRIEFVEKLEEALRGQVDVFGSGRNEVADKWSAIADYEYHVVVENSRINDYWTEKLSDCYLAWSFPIYYGCPNLDKYFSQDAYAAIDIYRIDESIKTIRHLIENDCYRSRLDALTAARELVLNQYNIFPVMEKICSALPPAKTRQSVRIGRRPSDHSILSRLWKRLAKPAGR